MTKQEAFNKLIDKISNDKFEYSNQFDKNGCDCLSVQVHKSSNRITKRMFFVGEFTDYNSVLILKKSVFEQLNSLITDLDTDKIYFVSFNQRNTIVFDLGKLEFEKKLLFIDDTCVLDYTDGKIVDFTYVEQKELPVKKYKLDKNGELVFESLNEFMSAPTNIQMRHVMERHLKNNLLPTENKEEMIKKYGSLENLYLFVRERRRIQYLARYNHIIEENIYEVK